MNTQLRGKWVLITGASSGFGAAAALAFAREGSNLLLGARRVNRLEQVAAEARKQGAAQTLFHSLDVASTSNVNTFFRWAKKSTDSLDVLINNAGGAHGLDPVAHGKDEDWEAMVQANLLGVLRVTRAAIPMLKHDQGSSIINIGSYAGHLAYEGAAAYCAVKAGEREITRVLRLELNGTGIRVGSIDPAMAETEFSTVRFKGDASRAAKVYEGTVPLTAEDIAETMVWVASRPPHVNIDEILIKCVDQATIYKIHRRK